jgi:hypothetical protein
VQEESQTMGLEVTNLSSGCRKRDEVALIQSHMHQRAIAVTQRAFILKIFKQETIFRLHHGNKEALLWQGNLAVHVITSPSLSRWKFPLENCTPLNNNIFICNTHTTQRHQHMRTLYSG